MHLVPLKNLFEDDLEVCPGIVDESDPEGRAKVREEIFFADEDETD